MRHTQRGELDKVHCLVVLWHVIGDIINSQYNLHGRDLDGHNKTIQDEQNILVNMEEPKMKGGLIPQNDVPVKQCT